MQTPSLPGAGGIGFSGVLLDSLMFESVGVILGMGPSLCGAGVAQAAKDLTRSAGAVPFLGARDG